MLFLCVCVLPLSLCLCPSHLFTPPTHTPSLPASTKHYICNSVKSKKARDKTAGKAQNGVKTKTQKKVKQLNDVLTSVYSPPNSHIEGILLVVLSRFGWQVFSLIPLKLLKIHYLYLGVLPCLNDLLDKFRQILMNAFSLRNFACYSCNPHLHNGCIGAVAQYFLKLLKLPFARIWDLAQPYPFLELFTGGLHFIVFPFYFIWN